MIDLDGGLQTCLDGEVKEDVQRYFFFLIVFLGNAYQKTTDSAVDSAGAAVRK